MKELLVIVGVTALGACVGLALRDQSSAAAPVPPQMQITTADAEQTARPVAPAPRLFGHTEETTLADGRRQVTHFNSNGSKGMQITYGNERAPTMPSGSAPAYRSSYVPAGNPAPRPAARC